MLRLAKLQAILMALLGLLAGIVYSLGGAIHDVATTGSVNLGTLLAFLALVGMPIVFAVGGAILGVMEAVLFNLFAKCFGGADLDLVRKSGSG